MHGQNLPRHNRSTNQHAVHRCAELHYMLAAAQPDPHVKRRRPTGGASLFVHRNAHALLKSSDLWVQRSKDEHVQLEAHVYQMRHLQVNVAHLSVLVQHQMPPQVMQTHHSHGFQTQH